jgi:hypothetical protein
LLSGWFQNRLPLKLPAPRLRGLEELVAVESTGDPDVVESCVAVDPVHGAGRVCFLQETLVDELQHVFHAEGDILDEDDGGVGGEGFGGGVEGLERLVAEGGEGFDTVDAVAGLGVDVVGGGVVGNVEGRELGNEGGSGGSRRCCRVSGLRRWRGRSWTGRGS